MLVDSQRCDSSVFKVTPDLVGCIKLQPLHSVGRAAPAPRALASQIEPFFLTQPLDSLVVHAPAFTPDEHIDALEPEPHPCRGNLVHSLLQRCVQRFDLGFVVPA